MTQHATPGGTVTEPHIEWEVVTKAELKRLREEHHELRIATFEKVPGGFTTGVSPSRIITYCPCSWAEYGIDLDYLTAQYREHLK